MENKIKEGKTLQKLGPKKKKKQIIAPVNERAGEAVREDSQKPVNLEGGITGIRKPEEE